MHHLAALDGVRGLAVLLVVLHHWELPRVFPIDRGLLGVRVFFVLSGYLITSILLDGRDAIAAGRTTLGHFAKSFYARRSLRIVPLFYATLAVLWLLDVAGVREEIGWHLAYATSFLVARTHGWIGMPSHFWSLAIEEQFYLAWPWVVLWLPPRRLRVAVFAMIATGVLWRALAPNVPFNRFAVTYTLPGCVDVLGVGALLAVVQRASPASIPRTGVVMAVVGAVLLAIASYVTSAPGVTPFTQAFAGTKGLAYALMIGALVCACLQPGGAAARMFSFAPLAYVGRVSYAVYVFHPMVPFALRALGMEPRDHAVRVVVWAAVTLAMAEASWRFFEGPINAQKKRFAYVGR